jgi:hypothetical protein
MARPTAAQDKAGVARLDIGAIAANRMLGHQDNADNIASALGAAWQDAILPSHVVADIVIRRPPGTDYANLPIGSRALEVYADSATPGTPLASQLWLKVTSTAWVPLDQVGGAIADPGNAGAISVEKSGYCNIVTAGGETRTLAAPSFLGQRIALMMLTAGGNGVVTCATTVNQAGNTTMTFGAVADFIVLEAFFIYTAASTASLRWRVAINDGVALG